MNNMNKHDILINYLLNSIPFFDKHLMATLQGYSKGFHSFVGSGAQLKLLCEKQKKHWFVASMRVGSCLKAVLLFRLPLKSTILDF